ncbi:cytochrome c3 family protein [Anaeromyxobacter soli]|uniref:cytochrome c3 family protein n=1 Tax=Anaeromyxobacter soli TaxID=2922725 RepID=UPI001FAF2585|nr:cytochrome c3 family protein [Anaeromyxobacter sp. SG29]
MPRGLLVIALAALLSVGAAAALDAPSDAQRVAMLGAGPRLVPELAEQALPAAPQQISLKTRTFGTVTVDHPAHLARRAHCVSCHGEGPIQKIEFTPKLAHERCRGCHKEQQAGPLTCRGCHALPAAAEKPLVAEHAAAPPAVGGARADRGTAAGAAAGVASGAAPDRSTIPSSPAPATSPATRVASTSPGTISPATVRVASTSSGPARATPVARITGEASADPTNPLNVPLRRVLEVGLAGGSGFGPAVRLLSRQENAVLSHSFDRVGGGRARSLGLLGIGKCFSVQEGVDVFALGLGGIDVVESPAATLLPAAGARIGVLWSVRHRFVETIDVSFTGVADLARSHPLGQEVGGATFFATIAAGVPLGPR